MAQRPSYAKDPRAEGCCWAAVGGWAFAFRQCSRNARPHCLTCRQHAHLEVAAWALKGVKKRFQKGRTA